MILSRLKRKLQNSWPMGVIRLPKWWPTPKKRAAKIVEEAKEQASHEAARITAQAKADVEQETNRAREALREQVAALAVKGAESILRSEVNADKHAQMLSALKQEL